MEAKEGCSMGGALFALLGPACNAMPVAMTAVRLGSIAGRE